MQHGRGRICVLHRKHYMQLLGGHGFSTVSAAVSHRQACLHRLSFRLHQAANSQAAEVCHGRSLGIVHFFRNNAFAVVGLFHWKVHHWKRRPGLLPLCIPRHLPPRLCHLHRMLLEDYRRLPRPAEAGGSVLDSGRPQGDSAIEGQVDHSFLSHQHRLRLVLDSVYTGHYNLHL